jgi:hypothetical protein
MTVQDAGFQRAFEELARVTRVGDRTIVRNTAGYVLRGLVIWTKELSERSKSIRRLKRRAEKYGEWFAAQLRATMAAQSRARAGWFQAWLRLGIPGMPRVKNAAIRNRREGGLIDRSGDIARPYVTMYNTVPYIERLQKERDILGRALAFQKRRIEAAIERIYAKNMRERSG